MTTVTQLHIVSPHELKDCTICYRTKRDQRSVAAEQFIQEKQAQEEKDLKEHGQVKHVSTFRQALPQVCTKQFFQEKQAHEEKDLKEHGQVKHVSTFRETLPQVHTNSSSRRSRHNRRRVSRNMAKSSTSVPSGRRCLRYIQTVHPGEAGTIGEGSQGTWTSQARQYLQAGIATGMYKTVHSAEAGTGGEGSQGTWTSQARQYLQAGIASGTFEISVMRSSKVKNWGYLYLNW
ncbi:hypothetical protein J6590_020633 [Homalodisca vitripennis]|nr:hypothetical protein J6590_020633 [Homalodisca vitripennis]